MNKALIVFAAAVACVMAGPPHPDAGPAGVLAGAACTAEGQIHVDSQNMCWFHMCVNTAGATEGGASAVAAGANVDGPEDEYGNTASAAGASANAGAATGNGLTPVPRRCALGSKVSYNYIVGFANPCTINFDSTYGYECMRTKASVDGAPECFENDGLVCQNGGTKTFEADKCWCLCPETWQGDYDCSKPTREVTDLPAGSNICVNGEPMEDWCEKADGCLNGGTCYNQCDSFWCDCPEHMKYNYKGKRCEDM